MARYGADTRYHKNSIDDMFEMYPKGSNEFDKLFITDSLSFVFQMFTKKLRISQYKAN